jgi:hypothetical protein
LKKKGCLEERRPKSSFTLEVIPMKQRSYRKNSFKTLNTQDLVDRLGKRRRLVLALDVGKTEMVAALADPAAEPGQHTVRVDYAMS